MFPPESIRKPEMNNQVLPIKACTSNLQDQLNYAPCKSRWLWWSTAEKNNGFDYSKQDLSDSINQDTNLKSPP